VIVIVTAEVIYKN